MDKLLSQFSSSEIDAAKLYLRSRGVTAPNFDSLDRSKLEGANWAELHAHRGAARKAATDVPKKLDGSADENEVRKAEAAHDILMGAILEIQEEIELRDSFGQREPVSPEQRGRPCLGDGVASVYGDDSSGPARRGGWTDRSGNEVRVYKPGEALMEGRATGYGVGDIARMMIFGPRNDGERRALSEGTDSAGGYTVPTRLSSEFIDKLRANSVCFEAGARVVPMDSDNLAIARLASDPTVSWTAENAEITASDPTFEAVTLVPKKLTALVKVSRELLEDSVNIGEMLEGAFLGRMGEELDRALLFGSGASNQPTGLFSITGINSVSMGTNGAIPASYDNLIDAMYEIQLRNGAQPSGFLMHPRTGRTYAKLKDANSNPLTEPEMTKAVRRFVTTAVPIDQTQGTAVGVASTVLTGDFAKMLVGIRRGIELRRLNERYAEFDQVGFIATLRADVAVTNPVHFAKLIGVLA